MKFNLPTFLFLLIISGCDNYISNYEAEMKVCLKGEKLGLLDTAVKACEKAVKLAETHNFSPELQSQSLYKLGSLKRQQGEFTHAEEILNKIIPLEKTREKPDKQRIAVVLLELSLSLAGQNKWNEGSDIINSLIPLINQLPEQEKLIAKNTLKHYAVHLKNKIN